MKKRSVDGQMKGRSISSNIESMILIQSLEKEKKTKKKRLSSMEEFLLPNKGKQEISEDNVMLSDRNIPIINSLKMLDQESISKDQDLGRYCPWFSKEKSEKLLLNTRTDFADLDTILLNGSSNVMASKSGWRTMWLPHPQKISHKISFQSSLYSVPDIMECEDTTKRQIPTTMSMKIRMRPTQEQKKILRG